MFPRSHRQAEVVQNDVVAPGYVYMLKLDDRIGRHLSTLHRLFGLEPTVPPGDHTRLTLMSEHADAARPQPE